MVVYNGSAIARGDSLHIREEYKPPDARVGRVPSRMRSGAKRSVERQLAFLLRRDHELVQLIVVLEQPTERPIAEFAHVFVSLFGIF